MPAIKQLARSASLVKTSKSINWHPGHMYAGMKAMIGKLNTVDCVIEVHDARIPLVGRNVEFREHLGRIKPHILVLNKSDLADLTRWKDVRDKLHSNGDQNVLLTDLTGTSFNHANRGYDKLLSTTVELVNNSDRYNRISADHLKVMIVGIPNVGKSTLINRLRQHHLGRPGEATRTGNEAGVTRSVEFMIKICARPLIYSLDTPGVLQPTITKNHHSAMRLALCSTINDRILNPVMLVDYLLEYLNDSGNSMYQHILGISNPLKNSQELMTTIASRQYSDQFFNFKTKKDSLGSNELDRICWLFVKLFRNGNFGKVMFD